MVKLWEGVCKGTTYEYETTVEAGPKGVWIEQKDEKGRGNDTIYMGRDEAIDIAFAILKDCAPTLAEALEGIRGPAAAGAEHTMPLLHRQHPARNLN